MFWLGGYRNYAAPYKKQSSWIWSDGAAMDFTAWAPGQPNNFWSDHVDNMTRMHGITFVVWCAVND